MSSIALVSSNVTLVYGFRTMYASAGKVHVFTDYLSLHRALTVQVFDIVFIDVMMAQTASASVSESLFRRQSFRWFYISAAPHARPYQERMVLQFPQDVFFLFRQTVAEPDALSPDQTAILSALVGTSAAMQSLKKQIMLAARTDIPVLITGETGVGKGLVAHTIHRLSARGGRDWVSVNVAAHADGLEAAALFGTVRGAFTDAQNRTGFFAQAQNSTLFLDEIGELKRDVQTKLLYAVENGVFRSVGAEKETHTNARLIFATNADLKKRMVQGAFREDLYYRIARLRIHIPPLRDRTEDILPLARSFAAQYGKTLSYAAQQLLLTFTWKGNVRQVAHCIERACTVCESDCIDVTNLSQG